MKAIDIVTPADYEIRPWKGGEHKARILRVEKVTVQVWDNVVRTHFPSQQWRAFPEAQEGSELAREGIPLGQVIRPWAEAEPEYIAKEAAKIAGQLGRQALEDVLKVNGIDVEVWGDGPYSISLSEDQAAALTDLLLGPDEDA